MESARASLAPSRIVTVNGGRLRLSFPYSKELVAAVKAAIPLAMWNRDERVWTVGLGSWREVTAFAKQCGFAMDEACRAQITQAQQTQVASRAVSLDVTVPVPEGLDYLPFQRAGIAFAHGRKNTLIADEMGLGKTIQAIGFLNLNPEIRRVLVVCPASLKLNWQRELQKWLVHPLNVGIASSDGFPLTDIVIINYDILHKHAEQIRQAPWHCLISDECHYVKNPKTRRSVMLFGGKVKPDAIDVTPTGQGLVVAGGQKRDNKGNIVIDPIMVNRMLLLTGTPICNRPKELFPLLQALDKEAWPSFWKYANRYCGAKQGAFGFDASGSSNLDELQDILRSTLMVRRLKKDVLTELPPKRRQVIELPAGKASKQVAAEHAAYERCQERLSALRVAVELAKASEDVEEYRQAVASLRIGFGVAFQDISAERQATAIATVPHALDHLHDALDEGDHKVVVFAHHKEVIKRIHAEFGRRSVILTGDMEMPDRQASVDRFQRDPSCVLFIGSIQAAGVGLTLTAASHVVFVEGDWVPGNMTQAEDRCHRIGQRDSVLVQHLVLDGSIGAKMAHTVIAKQVVIDQALDNDTSKRQVGGAEPVQQDEPVGPESKRERAATQSASRAQIEARSLTITPEEIVAVHAALQVLQARCDGAHSVDGSGFNKLDTRIGKELSGQRTLSAKQAALGLRLVRKYRKQLPQELRAALALSDDPITTEETDDVDHETSVRREGGPRCDPRAPEQEGLFDGVGNDVSHVD